MNFWIRHQYFTFFCAWIPLYIYSAQRLIRRALRAGKESSKP